MCTKIPNFVANFANSVRKLACRQDCNQPMNQNEANQINFELLMCNEQLAEIDCNIAFPFRLSGYFFMLRSQNQTANQIRRSYKNDEFDWPFYLVTVINMKK